MIVAISLIGFSNLSIDVNKQNFLDNSLMTRITIFTIIILILYATFYLLQTKDKFKGISLAICSGFMFTLSNFWISPLLGLISQVVNGTAVFMEIFLFTEKNISCNVLYL